ncbi:MAG TPA: TonB-dependent receptor plug domain-containing protein, partial [Lacunisphaera sp.]|nr:TonB-dependent receptor plug domain-containing protein [Lacunisphaera sp.]
MNNSSVSYLRKPLALLCVGLSLFAANAAFAQSPAVADKKDETINLDKFTVTGSYLPLTAEVSASPVVILERSQIGLTGATDPLKLLKTLTPFFSGNGNVGQELNNGGNGSTNIALRNLTTLVLLNGRRTSGDLSNIPVAMIERVEILKDSASTVYGSDAIGGVVNFILRKNYNGFEVGGRMSRDGGNDYRTKEAWLVGGVTMPGGFITVGAQYFDNSQLGTTKRHLAVLTIEELNALGNAPGNPPNY